MLHLFSLLRVNGDFEPTSEVHGYIQHAVMNRLHVLMQQMSICRITERGDCFNSHTSLQHVLECPSAIPDEMPHEFD